MLRNLMGQQPLRLAVRCQSQGMAAQRFTQRFAQRFAQRSTRLSSTAASHSGRQVTVDRPLPDVLGHRRKHRIYFGLFCVTMALSLFGMVKYEAANSPIVSSTLAALRRSELCQESVGPNVRFSSSMPWVTGSTGIAKDEVDFSYKVVGDDGSATVKFRAVRVPGEMRYLMEKWCIIPDQGPHKGETIDLVDEEYIPHVPMNNKEEPTAVRNNN